MLLLIMLITCINHDFDFLSCLAPQTSKGSEAPRAKEEPYQGVAGKKRLFSLSAVNLLNFFLFIICKYVCNCAFNINFTTFKQWKSSGSWAEKEQWTHNSNILMCSSSILCIRKILISKVLCAAIEEDVMMASEEVAVNNSDDGESS